MELPYDILVADSLTQERYRQMVLDGTSPRLAETLALQKPPGSLTDREFFKGHKMLRDEVGNDFTFKKMVALARARGGNPGPNDVYVSSLANGAGDPLAFVPPTGGRGHVKKVLEQRNWSADGLVKSERDMSRAPRQKREISNLSLRQLKRHYRAQGNRLPEQELTALIKSKHGSKKRGVANGGK